MRFGVAWSKVTVSHDQEMQLLCSNRSEAFHLWFRSKNTKSKRIEEKAPSFKSRHGVFSLHDGELPGETIPNLDRQQFKNAHAGCARDAADRFPQCDLRCEALSCICHMIVPEIITDKFLKKILCG